MQKRILILTNSYDLHADIVEHKLRDRSVKPFRINQDEFPRDFTIELRYCGHGLSGMLRHLPTDDIIELSDVGAVWARKPAPFSFLSDDLPSQEKAFAQAETEHLFFSLLYSLDCFWMNHPKAVRGALWKGEQLQRAAAMGFRVPRSLITNSPEAVRQLQSAINGPMVIKAMSSATLSAEDVKPEERHYDSLMTTLVSDEYLDAIDSVRELPCLFQAYVEKAYELRVTVIGEQVFAARIDSQQDTRTAIDYRNFSIDIPYSKASLPVEVLQRCRDFVQSYGLTYGALDLIMTPVGELFFLENNPGGQFLFVEQLVPELNMTDAVTELLLTQAKNRESAS